MAATSASNAWAVGFATNHGTQTLILHWNGVKWARVPSPSPGPSDRDDELAAVTAISSGNVWAVGTAFVSHQAKEGKRAAPLTMRANMAA